MRGVAVTSLHSSLFLVFVLVLLQFVASDAFLWAHLWGSAFKMAQMFIPQTDGELLSKFFNTLIPGKDWVSGRARTVM